MDRYLAHMATKRAPAVAEAARLRADRAYPEPHTAMEAAQYDTGRAENRVRLVRILGYGPRKEVT
jgi:hypothetical protein